MNAADFLKTLEGSSIEESLKFVKNNSEFKSIVLEDSEGNQFAVSHAHVAEMGEEIQVEKNKKGTFLVANWRRVKEGSFWVRADKAQSRKITLADILG